MNSSGRLRLWCILPGLVVLAGCATTTYRSGQTALHEGRYAAAAARFADVLARDPEHRGALCGAAPERLRVHPRVAAQVGRAVALMRLGTLTVEMRDFVRASLESEGVRLRQARSCRRES